jgi:ketosteroid isomerase-like protein
VAERDVELLRQGYEDFNNGDLTAWAQNLGPDFVVSDREELPDPQTYRGTEGAIDAATEAGEEFDDYRIEPDEIIDLGDHVLVVATQSGTGKISGARVEGPIVHLWRIRDGKAAGMQAYSTKEQALAALKQASDG